MPHKASKRSARVGVDEFGRTPLHYAAAEGRPDQVREQLARGLDPSAADDAGWTPLHFAAQADAGEVVGILLQAGAMVDAQDANGNTPLWRATFASPGRGDVIAQLRGAGADPFRTNRSGVSPLALARTIANYPVAQFYADLPG